ILERPLLGRDLGAKLHVLQAAAPARTEVRAKRCHALGRLAQEASRARELVGGLPPVRRELHPLAGQGAIDEYRLALPAAHAAPFLIDRFDVKDALGAAI